jgi:hypothetical protein
MKNRAVYTVLLLVVLSLVMFSSCDEKRGELKTIKYIGSYTRDFGDLNNLHLIAAKKIGIKPAASRDAALDKIRNLDLIESNEWYDVQKLTHSVPYLVSDAATLLEDIGRGFQDSLEVLNAPIYKVLVTSVLRTEKDVKRLQKRNSNASSNSAHRFATTFDISWAKYVKVDPDDELSLTNDQLKKVLATVLRDLKKNKRCYIKHERRQGCFHITAR